MEFFEKRIICKSTNEFFEKEKSWIKNNTIREVGIDESKSIEKFMYKNESFKKHIVIRNVETWEFFEREISDISLFKQWETHESQKLDSKSWNDVRTWKEEHFIYIISFVWTK